MSMEILVLLIILAFALIILKGIINSFKSAMNSKRLAEQEQKLESAIAREADAYEKNKRYTDENNRLLNQIEKSSKELDRITEKLESYRTKLGITSDFVELEKQKARLEKQIPSLLKKQQAALEQIRSIQHAIERFNDISYDGEKLMLEGFDPSAYEPISQEDLMCFQIKELRARYRENQRKIQELVESYKGRYSTKALTTIYQLMVLAMEAEMQNILHALRYGKLEKGIGEVKAMTVKYYTIATSGNQTISSTLTKFIGQLEYFYIESVKIEYEYYVKLERAKEEQRAIKEQMRQEAEERKILEQQKKQVEAEQSKYEREIVRINERIRTANETEIERLRTQLEKVQAQLHAVEEKKEDILKLQNGKAGTIYIISNIGSFGEDVFKVGMTRRMEPMDRVKELGDASVPFPFDVHSFIFSEDAVSLETELHHALNNKRVNKINLRKEFFRVSLDELQALVERYDPSAAFNRTALAEQFRQSQSITDVPDSVESIEIEDEEEQIG